MSILLKCEQILKYINESEDIVWSQVIDCASMMGDLNALKLLSIQNRKTDIQMACFATACKYGHKHIVNFFFEHLKQFRRYRQPYKKLVKKYCRDSFTSASKGGHLDIVKMIHNKYHPNTQDVDYAIRGACLICSWDVIFYLKKKFNIKLIRALRQACQGRHRKLVDWLMENGDDDWDAGLMGACEPGDVYLIQVMIERGATNIRCGFQQICYKGHVEATKYFLESLCMEPTVTEFDLLRGVQVQKLFMDYDETHAISICESDICPLLNEGVSSQTLLRYGNPKRTIRIVNLANKLLQVVQLSLRGLLCSDLVNLLKSFIGYDVNEQVIESMATYPTGGSIKIIDH